MNKQNDCRRVVRASRPWLYGQDARTTHMKCATCFCAAPKYMEAVFFVIACILAADTAAAANKLIELIPDKAMGAVYIERPRRMLPPKLVTPFLETLSEDKAVVKKLAEAIKRIPGPVLIGVITPPPRSEELPSLFVATEIVGPPDGFEKLVEETFLPAINAALGGEGGRSLKLEKGKTGSRILMMPGGDTVFSYAIRGKVAFGSVKPQLSLRWARGEWPQRRWVDMPGVKKMLVGLPKEASVRVLINPIPLFELIEKPKPNSVEELMLQVLAPEDVRAGAVDLNWDESALSVQATIALAEECVGLARVLARPANSARALGVFPDDFVAIGRLGWGSLSDVVEGAFAISDRFDETISEEYREELAEFEKETGVDWNDGLLKNLVGELAFGIRVNFGKQPPVGWAAVLPLGDADRFRGEFDKLVAHYELPFKDTVCDGVLVRKTVVAKIKNAAGVQLPKAATVLSDGCHLAIEYGLLILGGDAQIVADVAKQAAGGKKPRPVGANLRACYEALGDPNHLAVMLDIEQLRKKVPILPMVVGPDFAPMFAEGNVGMVATVEEQNARIAFRWSLKSPGKRAPKTGQPAAAGGDGADVMVMVTTALARSVAAARQQSQQVVSATHMRCVGQMLYMYADKHKGAFPESLEDFVRAMPDTLTLNMLTSPYTGCGPKSIDEVNRRSYVVYRPGLTTKSDPREIVLAEREVIDGRGANFLFVDSHVEFIKEPRASELLELIASGATEVRR